MRGRPTARTTRGVRVDALWSGAAIALLGWGALALGSVRPWGYWPLLAGMTALGAAGLLLRRGDRRRVVDLGLSVSLLAVAAAVVLQLVPLPTSLLRVVSPESASIVEAWGMAATPTAAESPGNWVLGHPVSVDPQATALGLVCLGGLGLFFIGSVRTMTSTGVRRLAVGLMGLGTLIALMGIIQKGISPDAIYGAWEPSRGTAYGPFPNKNHFAGWMLMALALTMGYLCAIIERVGQAAALKVDWRGRVLWFASAELGQLIAVGCAATVMAVALV